MTDARDQGGRLVTVLAVCLVVFTLLEVNYPNLRPQSQLALFALFGTVLCLLRPRRPGAVARPGRRWLLDAPLLAAAVVSCSWVVVQTEPLFRGLWLSGRALGDRAGAETRIDYFIGLIGLVVVLEATRRCVGWALPLLAGTFLVYALIGPQLPSWLFPHRGYSLERIVSQTFLHSQGVFGTALKVMFTYVFLFVVFGALLEADGCRLGFDHRPGGAACVRGNAPGRARPRCRCSARGLMGSLSGSAVANTATTGTFTIPLMRSAGFRPPRGRGRRGRGELGRRSRTAGDGRRRLHDARDRDVRR